MLRKALLAVCVLFLLPALVLAQDGKLRGKVTDKESGDPLIGANVTIDGTSLGAAADLNGDYVVLGVPAGVYTVKVSYIGYQPVALSNVRVSAGLTTTQDFKLASSAIEVGSLEIVAERPLVQRNTTNTVRLSTQEDIQNLPIRGLQNIVALNAGAVQQNGNLYIRGGRNGEVAYYIDGANVTNPLFNEENVTVIQEAIEEFQLQSGGYTAEFGGANSGLVRTTLRSGTDRFKATVDYRTDDFAKPGEQFLNTSSFGYRNAVLTLNGPLPFFKKLKYFVAAQHNYLRDRDLRFLEPFRSGEPGKIDTLKTDEVDSRGVGVILPENGIVNFERNYLPTNSRQDNSMQGTLTYDLLNNLKFRFSGSYQNVKNPTGHSWNSLTTGALTNFFWHREQDETRQYGLANLKATHIINPTTFYEVAVSYTNRKYENEDPNFGANWQAYPDSLENAKIGYTGFRSRYQGPLGYSTIYGFNFRNPNSPNNSYQINSQASIGASLDFTSQVSKKWELKVGGRFERWTMRLYSVGDIAAALTYLYGQTGNVIRQFDNEEQRRIELSKRGVFTFYGYDVDGKKINSGPDGPRNPFFGSAYLQNKLEYRDLVLNFGLRFESIDINEPAPLNLEAPAYDAQYDYIDESQLTKTKANNYVLPRVNFAFPVTEKTVFYAQYGKYVQMSQLNGVITSIRNLSRYVLPTSRLPYELGGGRIIGFLAKPERTTQYEMGIRHALTDNFALTITTFYKDLRDLLRQDRYISTGQGDIASGNPILVAFLNNDFGTVKGLEMTLELRRTKRLATRVNYTLSSARGTGDTRTASFAPVSDDLAGRFPNFINNLGYNQTHRGTLLLDYRYNKGDGGPILSGLGANVLLTFNSGHNYTQIKEPLDLGQASPWNIGIRPLIDPRNRNPVEPLNSSTTPWVFNFDLNMSKRFDVAGLGTEIYAQVLNVFNTKQIVNVYPSTGTAEDDGWLRSPFSTPFTAIPSYTALYNAINLQNRLGYIHATGNDLYGSPRQIRLGMLLEF
ncbi:MAG: TonB-dependent receptor [bacterium]